VNKDTKRMSLSIDPETKELLMEFKQKEFFDKTWTETCNYLLRAGLMSILKSKES